MREVLKKLQARYKQTWRICARRTSQTTRIEGFATPLTSAGRVDQEAGCCAGMRDPGRRNSTSMATT